MTVNWNEVTNATVHNVLKKFRVTVTKTDRETGTRRETLRWQAQCTGFMTGIR